VSGFLKVKEKEKENEKEKEKVNYVLGPKPDIGLARPKNGRLGSQG